MHDFTRRLVHLRRDSMGLRYGLLITLYVTPTLYACSRTYLDDTRVVVLNNAWDPVDVAIPVHANPRLPTLAREHLPNGRTLVNDLDPDERVRVTRGHIRVRLPGKTAAVYRAV